MSSRDANEKRSGDAEREEIINFDEQQMWRLGYKQQLNRSYDALESFISSFCAENVIDGVRTTFFLGMLAGGPFAMWTSYVISLVFIPMTALTLAEICSSLPVSGSLYIWAAVAAGPKCGRFTGFIVAWWITTAWVSFSAASSQMVGNFVVSLVTVYGVDFPGGISNDNIKWRTVVWAISEIILFISIGINYLPSHCYRVIFRISIALVLVDFFLCVIWLPIGVSKTFGFRTSHEAFFTTNNGTGATPGWNWLLSFLFAAATLMGFDAAGHVAEETKRASIVVSRSMVKSAVASGVGGLATTILFLFVTPNIQTLFSLNAPQPFVLIYTMALGRAGGTVMTIFTVTSATFSTSMIMRVASRLIFAIARDGALPLSSWVGRTTSDGRPANAVTVLYGLCATLLCAIIPSTTAFTSLMSGGLVPIAASYGIIPLLRLVFTPNELKSTKFSLGIARKPIYVAVITFNAFLFAVFISPFKFPVTASSLNFGGIIFGAVSILGLLSFWFTPESRWLSHNQIQQLYDGANGVPADDEDI